MSFLRDMMNGVIKRFEVFAEFFKYDEKDIDFKTRIDEYEIDDMSYLHTLHEYWNQEFNFDSPLFMYLERKKRLRVSRNGEGRKEMESILMERIEENKEKTNWEALIGK